MPSTGRFSRLACTAILWSQVLSWGLAPASFGAGAPPLTARRVPDFERSSGRANPGAAELARRIELSRSVPHRLGRPSARPWVTGRRPPLLAPTAAGLARTRAFTGEPETLRVLGLRVDFNTDRLGSQTTTPD